MSKENKKLKMINDKNLWQRHFCSFVISSFAIRHSPFVIRHLLISSFVIF